MNIDTNSHIAIAGGGLLGRLLAWQLLEQGYRICLYEAGSLSDSPAAGRTAAGMISPVSEAVDSEPLMYSLGMVALAQWPQWLARLNTTVDASVEYQQQGSLILAHHRDLGLLQQYAQDMQRMLGQLENVESGQWLDHHGIRELESDVATHFQQGLFLPQEAHIDNRHLLDALLDRIKQLGGECLEHMAVEVEPSSITLSNSNIKKHYDCVIDCRGVGAKPQWKSVRGVRGEVLRVATDDVVLKRPVRLLHPRYQLYVVPKPNQHFVIGATQIESEDRSPVTVQSALELNSALYTINPAFAEARIVEMKSNLRPALNDNRPQVQYQDGLIKVNGLYRHGYLLAPAVVQHALYLLTGNNKPQQDFSDMLYQPIDEPAISSTSEEVSNANVIA